MLSMNNTASAIIISFMRTEKSKPYLAYHYSIKYITNNEELFTLTYEQYYIFNE